MPNSSQRPPSVRDRRHRVLWYDTNYCGKKLHGIVKPYLQSSLPKGLQDIPSYSLKYGWPNRNRTFKHRMPVDEFDFFQGVQKETLWDLYFLETFGRGREASARLLLVPRGVFERNGPSNLQAVCSMGYVHLGALDYSRLRMGLSVTLQTFFGTNMLPHCHIETFLECLTSKRCTDMVCGKQGTGEVSMTAPQNQATNDQVHDTKNETFDSKKHQSRKKQKASSLKITKKQSRWYSDQRFESSKLMDIQAQRKLPIHLQ